MPCLQVVARLKQLQADAETIVAFLSNESAVQQLKQDKAYNLRFLQEVWSGLVSRGISASPWLNPDFTAGRWRDAAVDYKQSPDVSRDICL